MDLDKFNIYNPDDGSCFTIRDGGKIGIGTTEPDEKLHINGNLRLNGSFEDKDGNAGSAGQFLSSTETGTEWIASPSGEDNLGNHTATLDLDMAGFEVNLNGGWLSGDGEEEGVFVDSDGDVGIGTTNPTSKLEVIGDIKSFDGHLYLETLARSPRKVRLSSSANTAETLGQINFYQAGYGQTGVAASVEGRISSNSTAQGELIFRTRPYRMAGVQDRMKIDYSGKVTVLGGNDFIVTGNVGIGTATPKSKLQVNGGVQIANDNGSASADKAGTIRYRADSNNSYLEMCMQTGPSSYTWLLIKQHSW